jgi:AcrR family transcriptional regulator
MSLRQAKRAQVRARILEACEMLFRARGRDATSIGEIAAAAGISRQTFFNYFPGKDSVLTELAVEWLRHQTALPRIDTAPSPHISVLAEARRVVSAQARAIEADRAFMTLIITHAAPFAPAGEPDAKRQGADAGRDIFLAVADVIRIGQSSGDIRAGIDPLRIAEIYVSAMLMTVRLWLMGDAAESLEARVNATIDVLEGGIRARTAEAVP